MQKLKYQLPFYIKKLNESATLPQKGSEKAAGYDIYSFQNSVVPAKGKQIIKTGLAFAVPSGNYARIAPRSGLAWKNFIDVGAGVIDEDYRGEVGVILYNHSDVDFVVKPGDRIAQVIIEKISETKIIEVQSLDETERGSGGFGSTGVNNNIQENLEKQQSQSSNLKRNLNQIKLQDEKLQQQEENNYDWKEYTIMELHNLWQQGIINDQIKRKIGIIVLNENQQNVYDLLQEYKKDLNVENLKTGLLQQLI